MTFPAFSALQKRFRIHPPTHWLVASALKYKAPAEERREPVSFEQAYAATGKMFAAPRRFFMK